MSPSTTHITATTEPPERIMILGAAIVLVLLILLSVYVVSRVIHRRRVQHLQQALAKLPTSFAQKQYLDEVASDECRSDEIRRYANNESQKVTRAHLADWASQATSSTNTALVLEVATQLLNGSVLVKDHLAAQHLYERAWSLGDRRAIQGLNALYWGLGDVRNQYLWALRGRKSVSDELERQLTLPDILLIQQQAKDLDCLQSAPAPNGMTGAQSTGN